MPDALFADRRLADIYDYVDSDRSDLDVYAAVVDELGATSILDVGCGTGTFACLLAKNGKTVIGVDPAAASLEVARHKPYADRVRWVLGDSEHLPEVQVDLVTMTGNVAQVFLDEGAWAGTLLAAHGVLPPGGWLVFETRNPAAGGWREWTRDQSRRLLKVPEAGEVEAWVDLVEVRLPLVSFRSTYVFRDEGVVLTSDSTLRFRDRSEIEDDLARAGFVIEGVRDAPDRPGKEYVFLARKPSLLRTVV